MIHGIPTFLHAVGHQTRSAVQKIKKFGRVVFQLRYVLVPEETKINKNNNNKNKQIRIENKMLNECIRLA